MQLNQVTIPSQDLERSIKFYEKLGLNLIVLAPPHYARFMCPDGTSTFSIHLQSQLPIGKGTIVYFEDENIDLVVENLIKQGIVFDEMPEDKPWLWREAHLRDPDGNFIILFQAGVNRINPPWRIN